MAALDQPPPIICSIVQEEIGNRVQLGGRVISRQETQGNFSLCVIKNGPSVPRPSLRAENRPSTIRALSDSSLRAACGIPHLSRGHQYLVHGVNVKLNVQTMNTSKPLQRNAESMVTAILHPNTPRRGQSAL
jgi:hypothetical protein